MDALTSRHWVSNSGSLAWRGRHVGLGGPAHQCRHSGHGHRGGAGPEPTAKQAAPGGAELPAPEHAAPALPPGVPGLARPGGRLGPVAEHPALETPRPVARHPHLPAAC